LFSSCRRVNGVLRSERKNVFSEVSNGSNQRLIGVLYRDEADRSFVLLGEIGSCPFKITSMDCNMRGFVGYLNRANGIYAFNTSRSQVGDESMYQTTTLGSLQLDLGEVCEACPVIVKSQESPYRSNGILIEPRNLRKSEIWTSSTSDDGSISDMRLTLLSQSRMSGYFCSGIHRQEFRAAKLDRICFVFARDHYILWQKGVQVFPSTTLR